MHDEKLTKIVATLGPASDSEANISKLIRSGVNVFRFNTKHGTSQWHEERIDRVQRIADKLHTPIGILIDLQGPEIRIITRDEEPIQVESGQVIQIGHSLDSTSINLAIPHPIVFTSLESGDDILIDDGYVECKVDKIENEIIYARVQNNSVIKHKKGVNLPGKTIDLPSLIENDIHHLNETATKKVDFIALSFVRSADDIKVLRQEMEKRKVDASIVAKIESQPAIDNINEIIQASDAIMVARGDLGIEVPIEELAFWQKEIIRLSRQADKPVITATQMLESMITNPRPTRAEATDIANAVFDGTDAIMLSAETAAGKYPIRSVEHMSKIARFNEHKTSKYRAFESLKPRDQTEQVTQAAVTMINNRSTENIDKVVVFTETGYTARTLSSYRLNVPILAVTDSHKTVETLTMSYGVFPHYTVFPEGAISDTDRMIKRLLEQGIVQEGDSLLLIHGRSWREPGLTNSLSIVHV